MLVKREIAPSLRPGMHAATFGGNPIAARAGLAAVEMIEQQSLLERGKQLGELFRSRFVELQQQCEAIRDVRVRGVMVGVELAFEGAPIVKACLERELLINCTHGNVLRLLPALTLTEELAHQGCDIIADVLRRYAANA